MMDIYLVRHGEAAAQWGQSADPGLSERGRLQAEIARDDILGLVREPLALLSSPLARARETARPLAERWQCEVTIDDAYREVPAPVPRDQRLDWLKGFMAGHWDDQPAALHEWRERILDNLGRLERPSVIFTHFLVINAVVGCVQGRDEVLCFMPDNGSVTHLRFNGGALELSALGRELDTPVIL